jgi:hypothetical protein
MCWLKQIRLALNQHVMPANAGIHVFREPQRSKTWMAGTGPAMTTMDYLERNMR